jgi:hypothetical protein
MEQPPQPRRAPLRQLVAGKNDWSEPLSEAAKAKGFKGWHERVYLPHCDKPGLIQFVTFRLWDSLLASRRGEWEHLLAITERSDAPRDDEAVAKARREQRRKLEAYLDRSMENAFSATRSLPNSRRTRCAFITENDSTCWRGS